MNIIGKRNIFLISSGILVLAGMISVIVLGFKPGIDFAGGTLWNIKFVNVPQISDVNNFFKNDLHDEAVVTESQDSSFLVRLKTLDEAAHKDYSKKLQDKFGNLNELSFQSLGPSIGAELRRNAIVALILVIVAISLYIAFAFRKVSKPISSWQYGFITLITLFHDVAIPAGVFAWLSLFQGAEIDTNFIVAMLVIMGFSVHDTIVVFDRIRENLTLARDRSNLKFIVNKSINETFARSLNTSLTLVVVLVGMLILGPETLKYFTLTILVGVVAGAYSSIFVASPLLTVWYDLKMKRHGGK